VKLDPSFPEEFQDFIDRFNLTGRFDWTRQPLEIMMDGDRYTTHDTPNSRVNGLKDRLQELQSAVPELSDICPRLNATIRELETIERVRAYAASHPKVGSLDCLA
jgi:hypothetical protein